MNEILKILNTFANNIIFTCVIIGLALYFGIRVYAYLVPVPDTTLYLKKDFCGLVELADQKENDCFIKGEVRQDLFSNNLIFTLKNGDKMYINDSVVEGRMWVAK